MKSINPEVTQLDLDRHHLHNVRSAYLNLNQARLQLARETLSEAQRLFVDVLPALLHFNHPMLPGFVSKDTPSGLYEFSLDEEQSIQLRKLAKSFRGNQYNNKNADILSIFAMGSFGTIAQSKKSDIDLWVCHRPDLSQTALQSLEKKCELISAWCKTLNLEVTLFLMNHRSFQPQNKLHFGQEASGTTQRFLLLDEFYRTALYLAGQLPLWLFAHPDHESDYDEYVKALSQNRLLPDKHLIDFGPIKYVPASEFISAAIWQLYKAIDSPYKSIMKLLVLEIYCRDFTQLPLLSGNFKQQLHSVDRRRMVHLWDTDPYLQAYYFIENYLVKTNQKKRLELLRRCFYFKLEQPLTGATISKKAGILLELTKQWQWDEAYIKHLDNHSKWSLADILQERRLIIAELNHSYHFIMDFFRSQQGKMQASNRELNILGRKLHAAFSRKAGKIDWVNLLSSHNVAEDSITFKQQLPAGSWSAINRGGEVIIAKPSVPELIAWLYCNRVILPTTKLCLGDDAREFKPFNSVYRHLSQVINLPLKIAAHDVFEKSCQLKKLVFFIGFSFVESKPERKSSAENFVEPITVDCMTINSWNEIIFESEYGPCFEVLLTIYLDILQQQEGQFDPEIYCFFGNRDLQNSLANAVDSLFSRLKDFFGKYSQGRYIAHIGSRYMMLYMDDQGAHSQWLSSEYELKQQLAVTTTYPSPIALDGVTMKEHPLFLLANNYAANTIQVYFRPRGRFADITIIDEMGAWFRTSIEYPKGFTSLNPLHRFLRSINDRRHGNSIGDISPLDILSIHFYELVYSKSGWVTERCTVSSQLEGYAAITLYATAEYYNGHFYFTVHCDDQIFSEIDEGLQIYEKIAELVIAKRNGGERYPCYITDLDLSLCRKHIANSGELQTAHYLQVKSILERKINRALGIFHN